MAQSFTEWQYLPQNNAPVPGVYGPEPLFRDVLDQRRSGYRRTPEAEYPDGYLGTITDRREDRLLQAVQQSRLTQRSYQRGIHKGERIDPTDYQWSTQFNPMTGIELESQGRKFAPIGTSNDHLVAEGKLPLPRGAEGIVSLETHRADQLRRLAPSWR